MKTRTPTGKLTKRFKQAIESHNDAMTRFYIYDWAGNLMSFNPTKGFKSIDDASGFLSEYLTDKLRVNESDLEAEMEEYQYLRKCGAE
jgi:hypothetical protein